MSFQSIPAGNLAEKLRRDNCHQFFILVKMHLSFVLDLHTEDGITNDKSKLKRWLFYKKSKHSGKVIMEGAPLTQEGICQVYQLIEFLKKEQNITSIGIFRRTGSLARQQALKNLLNQGSELHLDNGKFSVHDCASVLKGFLAEQSEPLLTDAHFPAYCQLVELFGTTRRPMQDIRLLRALQLLLLLLPPENRQLLKDLLELLHLTAFYEHRNKMTADNLATLFTPHLLCPRKLSPENFHVNSQNLSGIVAFMIKRSQELFDIPPKLAVDIKAYYAEKEKKKIQSPMREVNESICDTARTVYSFVDHEKTTKENQSNPTETALAQLYAHIQSMPESSKKRKLIKQFNKENGQGIPLQMLRCGVGISSNQKTVGSSIKKITSFAKAMKINGFGNQRSYSEELLTSFTNLPRLRLFCANCNESSDVSNNDEKNLELNNCNNYLTTSNVSTISQKRSKSDPDLSSSMNCVTSTPVSFFQRLHVENVMSNFPATDDHESLSDSPITRSTQRMSKTMQETMMTPRSRKPLLFVSGTNLTNFSELKMRENANSTEEASELEIKNKSSLIRRSRSVSSLNTNDESGLSSLSKTFIKYMNKRSLILASSSDLISIDINNLSSNKKSSSLLDCLDGKKFQESFSHFVVEDIEYEKQLVLRPRQYDANGKPTVYETSF